VGAGTHPETIQERGKKSGGGNREGDERDCIFTCDAGPLDCSEAMDPSGRPAWCFDLRFGWAPRRRGVACGRLVSSEERAVWGVVVCVRGARFRFPLFALPVYSYFLQLPDLCPGAGRDLYLYTHTSHSTLLYFIFFIFLFNSN